MSNKLKIVNGEISYLSDSDDQSYGMWCPVSYECRHYFKEGDVLVVAKELESRIAELEQQLEKYSRSDLVWFARHEVKGLDQEQTGVINLNKIKADAVRDSISYIEANFEYVKNDLYALLMQYAEKLERGEL